MQYCGPRLSHGLNGLGRGAWWDIDAPAGVLNKHHIESLLYAVEDGGRHAVIRRKVGGLPPQLSIFELGFAGKGRIYYTRSTQQRYRILAVGAKNTQKSDLEYLSRLPS